jgi:hypothetical protein
METSWFKSDAELPRIVEYEQMGSPGCVRTDLRDSLSMSNDFTHCVLGDKLSLELLTADGEVVPDNIELEVQLDDKSFSETHEEVPVVLSTEETILFEEVRDTPTSLSLHDDREPGLLAVQSKVVTIKEDKIMLLTPHELESMKVNALESDSEKESTVSKNESTTQNIKTELQPDKGLTPVTITQGNEVIYMCPIEECSRGFPKLCMAKSHIVTHVGSRQFKVSLYSNFLYILTCAKNYFPNF